MSLSDTPARGMPRGKGPRLPVSIQRGVDKKLATVPHSSTRAALPTNRAPRRVRCVRTFSWACSHMLRQAITVTTGVSLSNFSAKGRRKKAVTGMDGDKNRSEERRVGNEGED